MVGRGVKHLLTSQAGSTGALGIVGRGIRRNRGRR